MVTVLFYFCGNYVLTTIGFVGACCGNHFARNISRSCNSFRAESERVLRAKLFGALELTKSFLFFISTSR